MGEKNVGRKYKRKRRKLRGKVLWEKSYGRRKKRKILEKENFEEYKKRIMRGK